MAVQQQQAYDLLRRTYRMRTQLVERIDENARKLHMSRSKLINDLLDASIRYCATGDSLAMREIREAFARNSDF